MSKALNVAVCQTNPTLGNFQKNIDIISKNYKNAVDSGADLVVFPEMSITCLLYTSPSPRDVEESRMPSSA